MSTDRVRPSSRWERATNAEREFLRATAPDNGEPSRIADITERLNETRTQSLGPARASLIGKGIVGAPEHGMIVYTVPGMADHVRRRDDDGTDESSSPSGLRLVLSRGSEPHVVSSAFDWRSPSMTPPTSQAALPDAGVVDDLTVSVS